MGWHWYKAAGVLICAETAVNRAEK
jgi:hypothetical protein